MIQRIQSIFLFLAAGACFGLFGTDAADTPAPIPDSDLFADGSFNVYDDPVLIGITVLAGVLLLAGIFLFKNRKLQLTVSRVALLLIIVGGAYSGYQWYTDSAAASSTPDFGIVLPVLTVIFGFLAGRYILKDEKLVRSADRLR